MEEYQPRYDRERSMQVLAAIATKQYPMSQWYSLADNVDTMDFYQRLQSVDQEQIEKAFEHIFHHIFYSPRNRDRDQPMLEARLGLPEGRVHALLEVTDEFGFRGPAVTQSTQNRFLGKMRHSTIVDITRQLVQ